MIFPFDVGGQKSTIVYTPRDSYESFMEVEAFKKLVTIFELEVV